MNIGDGRCLVLEDRDTIGQPGGPDRFRLNQQFWRQLNIMFNGRWGPPLPEVVSPLLASILADLIEKTHKERSWYEHPATWKGKTLRRIRLFVKFLRGGGFVVVTKGTRKTQAAAVFQFRKHS